MESTSDYGLLPAPCVFTSKQQKLLDELNLAILQVGIEIRINELPRYSKNEIVSLDVEHDESGGFVGCGIYNGNGSVYYFTNLLSLNDVPFHSLALVCHNGVSDLECLNTWGIDVKNEQLVWDTMLISHIIDSSYAGDEKKPGKGYGLKPEALRSLNLIYPSYDEIVGTHKRKTKKSPACPRTVKGCCERITLDKQPVELVSKYNACDVASTWLLYQKQRKELNLEPL